MSIELETENIKRNFVVISALMEGKQIQFKHEIDSEWEDWPSPLPRTISPWNCKPQYQWRVKPKIEYGWINVYVSHVSIIYSTEEQANLAEYGSSGARGARIACLKLQRETGKGWKRAE